MGIDPTDFGIDYISSVTLVGKLLQERFNSIRLKNHHLTFFFKHQVLGFQWFLLSSLRLDFMPPIGVQILTCFGLLSPDPSFDRSFPLAVCGGNCALPCAVVNLRALMKGLKNESTGARTARQDMNAVAWFAWTITWALATMDGLPGTTGTFGMFWMTHFMVCFVAHALILKNDWNTMRGPQKQIMFKVPLKDKVDLANAVLFSMFGVVMFLGASVRWGPAREFLPGKDFDLLGF